MKYSIRMRVTHHRRLAEVLRAAVPAESVAFLLCRRCEGARGVIYLVDEVLAVPDDKYEIRSPVFASVSASFMARIAQKAKCANQTIVMTHIHPMTLTGVQFSTADHQGNARSFSFFLRRTGAPEHLALVWDLSVEECQGVVYRADGSTENLTTLSVVDGTRWKQCVPSALSMNISRFDRQARMLGQAGQIQLSGLNVTVIGSGGTGALASLALVHHGVRHLTLVDDEVVDETNLHRLPASKPSDVGVTRKVDLAAAYALRHAPDADLVGLPFNVESPEVLPYLIESDVVVVGTDNTTSRAFLNQIGQQYLIPLLDLGVQFVVDDAGAVTNEVGRINFVRPGTPCLCCSGHISPARLAAESIPRDKRNGPDSYLRGLDDPQPSMLAFNMEVVGRGIQVLVGFVTGLFSLPENTYELRTFLRTRGGGMSRSITKVGQRDCIICGPSGVIGLGCSMPMLISRRAL